MLVRRTAAAVVASILVVGACEPSSVAVQFDPAVGDTYRLRSDIETDVSRTIADETTSERTTSRLDATERVTAVDDESVEVEVTVERDGGTPRTYEVQFDPTGRLSAIDLIEGVPVDALGLDLATDLPSDISSPPPGPLEPSTAWTIERIIDNGTDPSFTVTGSGRVTSFGVEDGIEVAVVEVEVRVPLRSVVDTVDGRVAVRGRQTVRSRTTYDIEDGTARTDRTEIVGAVDVIVEPPVGIVAPPVPGRIEFTIDAVTRRVRDS